MPGFRYVPDPAKANHQLLRAIQDNPYDVVWLDKALTITASALSTVKREQPGCRIVGYCCDDILNKANRSRQLLEHIHLYDVFFTTKSFQFDQLRKIGCQCPVFIENGYDAAIHRPLDVSDEERKALGGAVGFIGGWEKARSQTLSALARDGIRVRVWGSGWHKQLRSSSESDD